MVTFKHMGRYGNQLFEIAATYGYARRHGIEFTVPTETKEAFWQPVYYTYLANKKYDPSLPMAYIREMGHHYQELPFQEEWRNKNILLEGYFQTEKYFKEFRQEIIELFQYHNSFSLPDSCSIFVRRGDYLINPDKHPPITIEYIFDSMDYIMERTGVEKFIVFSDDMPWCRQWIKREHYEIEFNSGLPYHIELQLISCCAHNIIANGTFAWWGAWFNQNPDKIVIAPKIWFGPGNSHLDTKDVCPEEWIRL